MAVSRKVDRIIEKGGEVKSEGALEENSKVISQRINLAVLAEVDEVVKKRHGLSRSAWIQEAIQEKLKRSQDVH